MSIDITLLGKTISLVAKRGSGKSILLKYLVTFEREKFHKIFCICPTECVNGFYSKLIPANCIFDSWSEDWTENLIKQMTQINKGKPDNEKKSVLLILDDLICDVNFASSPSLKKLYSRGRHIFLSVIITQQYLYGIPPVCRNNTDYCLVGQLNRASIQLLLEEYMSGEIDRKDFIALYNRATIDYNFLVINCNSVKSGDLNEIYGIIKAPI